MAMNEADALVEADVVRRVGGSARRQAGVDKLQRQLMLFERKEAAKQHRKQKRAE